EFNAYGADMVGDLRTPLEDAFQGLTYNGSNLEDLYGNAQVHRLRRSFDFYNVELNLIQDPNLYSSYNDSGGFNVGMVGGLRFFRFSDGMQFSSNTDAATFVGGADEIHYGIDADNNLFGAQLGMLTNYTHRSWDFYGGAKVGLFGNYIDHQSRIYGTQGNAVIVNGASPNNGREFDVSGSRTALSFLCELDLGASYQVTQRFSVRGGYRAVALTGMALSTDQIPQNFEDLGVVASTQASSSVILHGAYFGGEFVW
ncbi:MAG: BBP7 family outer membrane beta-barrel protein, partial [Pirellulaceae bacterium]